MILNSNQIQDIIPHRQPFLLVDQIDDLIVGQYALGKKCVSANDFFFAGHFPDNHIMPGVLIIEALAQVGAVAILSDENYQQHYAYFTGIKNAKFRQPVRPGDVLVLETSLKRLKGMIGISSAKAMVNNTLVCECEMSFAIIEKNKA